MLRKESKHESGVSCFQSTSREVLGTRYITMLIHNYATFAEKKNVAMYINISVNSRGCVTGISSFNIKSICPHYSSSCLLFK